VETGAEQRTATPDFDPTTTQRGTFCVSESPNPWEQQVGETAKAYAAFTIHRDQGPQRTLAETGRRVYADKGRKHGATGRIQEWAAKYRWRERATAFDQEQDRVKRESQAEQDRLRREAQAEAIKEMEERHAQVAVALLSRALQGLQLLQPAALSHGHLLAYITEAAKLERLSRGKPESVVEQKTEVRGDSEFFKRVEQYAEQLRRLQQGQQPRVPAGTVPDDGNREPVAETPTNGSTSKLLELLRP